MIVRSYWHIWYHDFGTIICVLRFAADVYLTRGKCERCTYSIIILHMYLNTSVNMLFLINFAPLLRENCSCFLFVIYTLFVIICAIYYYRDLATMYNNISIMDDVATPSSQEYLPTFEYRRKIYELSKTQCVSFPLAIRRIWYVIILQFSCNYLY